MPDASSFSPDYVSARARFRSSALGLGCHMESQPIQQVGPDGEGLTLDLARLGPPGADRILLVTSGLHGVEGYLGSAIQAALLEDAIGGWRPPGDSSLILIHALNPWGMAWGRRVNEDNVDLNRNFLMPEEPWRGMPEGYAQVDRLLNPRSAPSPLDPMWPRAVALALRNGSDYLPSAAAKGQYDRPRGLFFGGNGPSRTSGLLREHLPRWLGDATSVLHLDLHTGVGPRGRYLLLSQHILGSTGYDTLADQFGADSLVPLPVGGSGVRGEFIPWMKHHVGPERYDGLVAEFGTVRPISLLAALRDENRAHFHGDALSPRTDKARERLAEALNPTDRRWRDRAVPLGVRLVQRALEVQLGATVSEGRAAG